MDLVKSPGGVACRVIANTFCLYGKKHLLSRDSSFPDACRSWGETEAWTRKGLRLPATELFDCDEGGPSYRLRLPLAPRILETSTRQESGSDLVGRLSVEVIGCLSQNRQRAARTCPPVKFRESQHGRSSHAGLDWTGLDWTCLHFVDPGCWNMGELRLERATQAWEYTMRSPTAMHVPYFGSTLYSLVIEYHIMSSRRRVWTFHHFWW